MSARNNMGFDPNALNHPIADEGNPG